MVGFDMRKIIPSHLIDTISTDQCHSRILLHAAETNQVAVVEHIVSQCEVNEYDLQEAYDKAARYGNLKVISILIKHCKPMCYMHRDAIYTAISGEALYNTENSKTVDMIKSGLGCISSVFAWVNTTRINVCESIVKLYQTHISNNDHNEPRSGCFRSNDSSKGPCCFDSFGNQWTGDCTRTVKPDWDYERNYIGIVRLLTSSWHSVGSNKYDAAHIKESSAPHALESIYSQTIWDPIFYHSQTVAVAQFLLSATTLTELVERYNILFEKAKVNSFYVYSDTNPCRDRSHEIWIGVYWMYHSGVDDYFNYMYDHYHDNYNEYTCWTLLIRIHMLHFS